jgi:hypothetical protein
MGLTTPKKKVSHHNPQPGWPIYESRPSFSPAIAIEAVSESQSSIDKHATSVYLAHIYWWTGSILALGGQLRFSPLSTQMRLPPRRSRLPHQSPCPSQSRYLSTLHFSLVALFGLQQPHVITSLNSRCEVVTYSSPAVFEPFDFYQILWLCLAMLMSYS